MLRQGHADVDRVAPAQVDLLMVQLNSEGEFMEHGQLDSKNTRTEWRRADRAGQKQSDLSPWRLTGETALQSWPEANDRNHSISVNLDYVAPDVHSLVFVARARGAALLPGLRAHPELLPVRFPPATSGGLRPTDRASNRAL